MRKMIAAVVLCVAASPAFAQHGRHHQHDHHRGYGWVGPAVIGTVIGGVLIASQRGYSPPAPVYYPPAYYPPVQYQQYQQPRPMIRRVDVYIPECDCTRTIEVQIQ